MSISKYLLPAMLAGVLFAGTSGAGATEMNNPRAAFARSALGGASIGKARLGALVGQSGAVIRSKNVAAVTHPGTGIVCIFPRPGVLNVRTIVPSVSVEWGFSLGNSLLVFYEDGAFECPVGSITVFTYNLAGARSDLVAFTIVVP